MIIIRSSNVFTNCKSGIWKLIQLCSKIPMECRFKEEKSFKKLFVYKDLDVKGTGGKISK